MAIGEIHQAKQLQVFQNRMFRSKANARKCANSDIVLVRNLDSGLIHNQSFQSELMQYDADHQNEQAVSPVFRTHMDEVAANIQTHFQNHTLIEVGCGQAYFLLARGFAITGLDPTYAGHSPHVIKQYFTPEVGLSADGIVLRHVLEHVRNPVEFLRQVLAANGGACRIYIEAPCFDWICAQRAWFDIFSPTHNSFQ